MPPERYDHLRYLKAKRSVDDRALHRGVLDALGRALIERPPKRRRVLELGAGVGNMAARLHALGVLPATRYCVLERDAPSLQAARQAARELAGFDFSFIEADVHAYLRSEAAQHAHDACFANALLDLLDLEAFLPELWRALPPDGLLWASINFDGETIFLPELRLDAQVLSLYHASMDCRPAGDSKSGRHLLERLLKGGATVLAAGSSDWVVWPTAGRYPEDEAYFLHHIVHTIDLELRGDPALDAAAFEDWVQARHRQIDDGELTFVVHQLDVLAQAP